MTLSEAIKTRRSVGSFKSNPISDEIIEEMLESARLAPSGGNAQNYTFGIIRDESLKTQLAQAAGNQMWIASAPVVIAGCGDISWDIKDPPEDDFGLIVNYLRFGKDFVNTMKEYPDRRALMKLWHNGSPVIAMEHMFLTAVSHGLSACFIGYLDVDRASEILSLPDNLACLFLLPVGYTDEISGPKTRKSIDDISFHNRWDSLTTTQ
ncbi:MAG: nitroreductase family protein [Defluviitaleaceae bacterium]|nr:nitroreductase family protein [Defluviitaleaceae bacterium]